MSLHGWELVDRNEEAAHKTLRMRVPGGWIYRFRNCNAPHPVDSLCFVPDPDHRNPGPQVGPNDGDFGEF